MLCSPDKIRKLLGKFMNSLSIFATVVGIVCLGYLMFVYVVYVVPAMSRGLDNYFRERNEREFHLMTGCVYHEFPEEDRDRLIDRYVGWSDRRWNVFLEAFGNQTVLEGFIPDIEMLRALK